MVLQPQLLSYDPGGGHTDQLRDLSLGLAIAAMLNRTLLLPRLLWHRDANVYTTPEERVRLICVRPALSAFVEVLDQTVPLIDDPSNLVRIYQLPPCSNSTSSPPDKPCVHWAEPPRAGHSVGTLLRSLASPPRATAKWVHFSSMLDVLTARKLKRYPLAQWESQLRPSACTLRYRPDVLAAATEILRVGGALPPATHDFVAAHVRALRRDRFKSECPDEWIPRLVSFVRVHLADVQEEVVASSTRGGGGPRQQQQRARQPQHVRRGAASRRPLTLYLATDDLAAAVPAAAAALAPLNVTVTSARDAPPQRVLAMTAERALDSEAALMALDVAAVLAARAFSPAPRSGLSVHLTAMRGCARGDACDPAAAACVPYASAGCGGRFPPQLAGLGGDPPRCTALRPRVARRAGDELCVDDKGVERQYWCGPGTTVPAPGPKDCGGGGGAAG